MMAAFACWQRLLAGSTAVADHPQAAGNGQPVSAISTSAPSRERNRVPTSQSPARYL